jgi:hypothetical protein
MTRPSATIERLARFQPTKARRRVSAVCPPACSGILGAGVQRGRRAQSSLAICGVLVLAASYGWLAVSLTDEARQRLPVLLRALATGF